MAGCEDHVGFHRLSEVLAQLEGTVIPAVALLDLSSAKHFFLRSGIGYLLSSKRLHRLAFPVTDGVLQWEQGGQQEVNMAVVQPVPVIHRLNTVIKKSKTPDCRFSVLVPDTSHGVM